MQNRPLTATLLGTGTSTGVPVIGCGCRVCTSSDPRDSRTRCAAFVVVETEPEPVHVLIDVGPDFRTQALREGIARVDALLITHHHFDHIFGLDDLRPFFFDNRRPIPVYATPETAAVLRSIFAYIFEDGSYPGISRLELVEIGDGPFEVASRYHPAARVPISPVPAMHGALPVMGFRIGGFGYLTDVSEVPETSREIIRGVEWLALDGLRHEPHPAHLTLDQAAELAADIGAGQTRLIHTTHTIMHREADNYLPEGVAMGFDGLQMRTSVEVL